MNTEMDGEIKQLAQGCIVSERKLSRKTFDLQPYQQTILL